MAISKRLSSFFVVFAAFALLVGCSGDSDDAGAKGDSKKMKGVETLADHDVELPKGIEAKLPVPKDSDVKTAIENDGYYGVTFSPGQTYPESIKLFSEYFEASDWIVKEEDIPDRIEGEREAMWTLLGDGLKVYLSITAFGEEDGFNMTSTYSVEEAKEGEEEDALAGYERDSSTGEIKQSYKHMDKTSLTDEYLPELTLLSEAILDDAKIIFYEVYDDKTDEDYQGYARVNLFYEGKELPELAEEYDAALEAAFDEIELAGFMLNAQDQIERNDQALENGMLDQDTYDALMEEINLDDIYEVSAFNDEGKVDISIRSKDPEDEETETGVDFELDGEVRNGSIVEVSAMKKGFGGWEEQREQQKEREKQMGQ